MKTLLPLLFFPLFLLHAQHTLSWQEETGSPEAALADIAWISGYWEGEALGGITEEIWSHPLGDSMMGSFKLVVDDRVKFYELCTISKTGRTLILKIKHFHGDLKGWEEKEETEDFPLVKLEDGLAYFDGLTFEKVNADEMNIHVLFKTSGKEITFNYKRRK